MKSRQPLVAGLTAAAVILIVAGVAAVAIDSGPDGGTPARSASHSPTPTSLISIGSPTASPTSPLPSGSSVESPSGPAPTLTAAPTPTARTAGFVVQGASIIYYTADGTAVPMEPVPGLRMALVDGRALYYAQSPNPYGMRTGVYAGEFVPNVTTQQADGSSAQTGGVVLVGAVATRLIADRLAALATSGASWIVALPVDIRATAAPVDVAFDTFGLHGWADTPRVAVRFSGELPVTEINPGNAGYHVLVEQLGVTTWQAIDPLRLTLSPTKLDVQHLMNELLIYGTGAASTTTDVLVGRRVPVGKAMLSAAGEVSVSLTVKGSHLDLGPTRILELDDVPVFVAAA